MRISRCKIACMRGNNWIFLSCSLGNILSYFSFGCWWNEKKKAEKMGREIGMKGKKSKRQRIAINAIHVHVNGEKRGTAYDDVWRKVTFSPKFILWTVHTMCLFVGKHKSKNIKWSMRVSVLVGVCMSQSQYFADKERKISGEYENRDFLPSSLFFPACLHKQKKRVAGRMFCNS